MIRECPECEKKFDVWQSNIDRGKYKVCSYKCRKANGVNWGERSGRTHLKWHDVATIRELYKPRKRTLAMLAGHYNVCIRTIQDIVKFRTWA